VKKRMNRIQTARCIRAAWARAPFPTGYQLPQTRQFSLQSVMGKTGLQSQNRVNKLPALYMIPSRSMFIQTEKTPNPASLKFIPGVTVLEEEYGSGMDFTPESDDIAKSPLVKQLMKINGTNRVFLGRTFISVTKNEDIKWEHMKPHIFATIMDFYAEGTPVVVDAPQQHDTTILDTDDEVVALIKELLETRIRPAVQEDGGDIFYISFDEESGIVSLQLAGSCAGCPSSSVTLKNGVENMLMHYIPEVRGVMAIDNEEV